MPLKKAFFQAVLVHSHSLKMKVLILILICYFAAPIKDVQQMLTDKWGVHAKHVLYDRRNIASIFGLEFSKHCV